MRVNNGKPARNGYFNMGGAVDWPPSGAIGYDDILERQIFKESGGNPEAVSPAGARGLGQITPITEDYLRQKGLIPEDWDAFSPEDSRYAQRVYMDSLMGRSWNKGSEEVRIAKALSGYNYGPTATVRALEEAKDAGVDIYNTLDWLEYLPLETRDYVSKILGYNDKFEVQYRDYTR